MSKTKKILLALKVFLPILIKGIMELYENIIAAYEDQNQEVNDEMNKEIYK